MQTHQIYDQILLNRKSKIENRKSKIENRKSKIENRKSKIENRESQIAPPLRRSPVA